MSPKVNQVIAKPNLAEYSVYPRCVEMWSKCVLPFAILNPNKKSRKTNFNGRGAEKPIVSWHDSNNEERVQKRVMTSYELQILAASGMFSVKYVLIRGSHIIGSEPW